MFVKECLKRLKDPKTCRLITRIVNKRVLRYNFRGIKMAVVIDGPIIAASTGQHLKTGKKHVIFMLTETILVIQLDEEFKAAVVTKEHAAMLNPHGKALESLFELTAEIAGNTLS